jgi:hypothetical protein
VKTQTLVWRSSLGALGVDELVTGKLTQVGTERVMIVRRIDQKRAEVQGTFDQRLKAESGQELLASVGPAVEKLYGGYQLRDGTTRGVSKEVALRLDPPPLPKWTTITVGALAVGAAGRWRCVRSARVGRSEGLPKLRQARHGKQPN